jgi:hypothetical protein
MSAAEQIERTPQRFFAAAMSAAEFDRLAEELTRISAGVVKIVDGARCRSKDAFMDAVAAALDFPDYFGRNWDALEECLDELSWQPANRYRLLFRDSDALLADAEPRDASIFLQILAAAFPQREDTAGAELKIVFHVVDISDNKLLQAAKELRIDFVRLP